ncbi:MAG: PilW family protein, partial [Burkholderiaceae bacterium]
AVYSGTTSGSRVSETEARLNENAAITLGLLQQQIRLASYSAVVGSPTFTLRKNLDGAGSAGIRGCTGGFSVTTTTAFSDITCNNTTASDALVVRYEADTLNTMPVGVPPAVTPTNCIGESITASTPSSATGTGGPVQPLYALADNRYFVRTVGTPSGGPELYCQGARSRNAATGVVNFSAPQPIMEGVERMHLTFGVASSQTATFTVAYMTANAIDTTFAAEPERWRRVITARVCLLLRNTSSSDLSARSANATTNQYFDCNNVQQTSTDGFLRRAYTSTILLKNRLSQ